MDYISRAKKFRTKKSLGQNFLVDSSAIKTIIESANLTKEDIVLEIGAGLGFVTEQIAPKVQKVFAVEIDKDAIAELKKLPFENIEIIERDILKTDISKIANSKKIKIIANIPYYITSPILAHLLGEIDDSENKNRKSISEIILMVQYEVSKRICATPTSPNKEYGSLSILCNFYSDTKYIKKVGKKSFFPSPKVDSAILKITPIDDEKYQVSDKKLLKRIITSTFQVRRKTLKNALSIGGFSKENIDIVFSKLKLEQTTRGEKLPIKTFCNIADEISVQIKKEKPESY